MARAPRKYARSAANTKKIHVEQQGRVLNVLNVLLLHSRCYSTLRSPLATRQEREREKERERERERERGQVTAAGTVPPDSHFSKYPREKKPRNNIRKMRYAENNDRARRWSQLEFLKRSAARNNAGSGRALQGAKFNNSTRYGVRHYFWTGRQKVEKIGE